MRFKSDIHKGTGFALIRYNLPWGRWGKRDNSTQETMDDDGLREMLSGLGISYNPTGNVYHFLGSGDLEGIEADCICDDVGPDPEEEG